MKIKELMYDILFDETDYETSIGEENNNQIIDNSYYLELIEEVDVEKIIEDYVEREFEDVF